MLIIFTFYLFSMQHATLCFIRDNDHLLLIEKKTGVGEGLYNGPGGKIEGGETPLECAIRETKEEVGVHVPEDAVEKKGELRFVFGDDPFMHVHVFTAEEFHGDPTESVEARPEWFHVDELPFEEMWPDDKHWLPLMLDGQAFKGEFFFDEDGDEIRDYRLDLVEQF